MTFYRTDGWVKSVLGQALAGVLVYVCTQPANSNTIPPSPLASIFADNKGLVPITQPLPTDGFGHYNFYAASGQPYTIIEVNGGNVQSVYPDQAPMGATF